MNWALAAVEDFLLWLPWFVLPILVFVVVARNGKWKVGLVAAAAMTYPGLVGLWEVTIETLALMAIAVLISVAIGVPLGVWAALRPRVESVLRPILDAMQTVPAPVYFIPMLLFFGIGRVPATIATVIYALPPAVRLTTLGITRVPKPAVEASEMFGSTKRQTLFKVQLPMAMPTIMTGVNQTIMMALGIVVLATLLGAGGLGQEVMDGLSKRRTGRGLAAGLAIVAVAMVLDRIGRSVAESDRTKKVGGRWILGALGGSGRSGCVGKGPRDRRVPDSMGGGGSGPDRLGGDLGSRQPLLHHPPPQRLHRGRAADSGAGLPGVDSGLAGAGVLHRAGSAGRSKGSGLAIVAAVGLLVVGFVGMWELSLQTLTQVVAGVLLSLLIAIPVGIWAGRRPKVEAALGPDPRRFADDSVLRLHHPGCDPVHGGTGAGTHRLGALRDRARDQNHSPRNQTGAIREHRGFADVRCHPPSDHVRRADPSRLSHHHGRREPGDHDGAGDGDHRRSGRGRGPRIRDGPSSHHAATPVSVSKWPWRSS